MYFLVVLRIHPSPALWFTPSVFGKWKVLRWYIYQASFIYIGFVVPQFSMFKCLPTSRKYHFRLLLGGLLPITSPNLIKFVWNFHHWCNSKQCIKYVSFFHFIQKKWSKLGQKANFVAYFERFFVYILLRPVIYAPVFCQIIRLMEVHNGGKFYQYSICGFQVIKFGMFSWLCIIHEMIPFGWFLGPFSPKHGQNLLTFWPEVVCYKKKRFCKQCFKIMCLRGNKMYPKFMVLNHLGAQFPPENPKYGQQPKFSQKLHPLDYYIT